MSSVYSFNYKMKKEDYNDLYDEEVSENETRLTFRLIKGKPNKNPDDCVITIQQKCPEVQHNGRTHLRILCGTPADFKVFNNFCHNYLGNFPAEFPYVYIPKSVLVQQPKEKKRKNSLFKY